MSKRHRVDSKHQRRAPSATDADDVAVVGGREPCPCGSGRRYKACHGKSSRAPPRRVVRPFAGLASEPDWVALHDMVAGGDVTAFAPRLRSLRHACARCCLWRGRPWYVRTVTCCSPLRRRPRRPTSGRDLGDALAQALSADAGHTDRAAPAAGRRTSHLRADRRRATVCG